jgi:hypothetical protein
VATRLVAWTRERSGELAGDWLQVTYVPDDETLTRVWSIEWLRVRQRKKVLRATAWRLSPLDFQRKWALNASAYPALIEGIYWAERGRGGHGQFQLIHVDDDRYSGNYRTATGKPTTSGVEVLFIGAPMEWVKVGSDRAERLTPLIADHLPKAQRHLPWYLRRRVAAAVKRPTPLSEHWAYASAIYNPQLAFVWEAERRRAEEAIQRDARPDPSLPEAAVLDPSDVDDTQHPPAGEPGEPGPEPA